MLTLGFLRTSKGWRLAPAFDVNPEPSKHEHALGIGEGIHAGDLDVVAATANLYGVGEPAQVMTEVRKALVGWQKFAIEAGISREEIEVMGDALPAGADD